jgi:hypothetical protein
MRKSAYIFATTLLIGCGMFEKEISGNVFIVREGGGNIKLGLIPISITPKDVFEKKKERAIATLNEFYSQNIVEFTQLKSQYEKDKQLFEPLEVKHKEYDRQLKEIIKRHESIPRKYQDITIVDFKHQVRVWDKESRPYAEQVLSDINKIVEENKLVAKEMQPIYEKLEKITEKLEVIKKASIKIEKARVRKFMESLADEATTLKSNADGNFKTKINKFTDYVVSAYGETTTGIHTKMYNWMVEIKSGTKIQDDLIIISNDSLIDNIPFEQNDMNKISSLRSFQIFQRPITWEKFKIEQY